MSLPEEKFEEDIWRVLKKIKERSLYANTEKHIPYFVVSDIWDNSLSSDDEIGILRKLAKDGVIKLIDPNSVDLLRPDVYIDIIQPAFYQLYEIHKIFTDKSPSKQFTEKTVKNITPIKNLRLDTSNHFLEINSGEKIISFKSKKGKEGLEKETKQFKILYHLWDFRWEIKNDRVVMKGDFVSLDNLTRGSESKTTDATYKHIQRLNTRLKKAGVLIKIKGENGKYRLIIVKE